MVKGFVGFVRGVVATFLLALPYQVLAADIVSYDGDYLVPVPSYLWSQHSSGEAHFTEEYTPLVGNEVIVSESGDLVVKYEGAGFTLTNKPPGHYTYTIRVCGAYSEQNAGGCGSARPTVTVDVFMPGDPDPENETPYLEHVDLSKFDIYYGDFNDDGIDNDIYFHGRDVFVLIASDIAIPLFLEGPQGFVYYGTQGGYYKAVALDLETDGLANYTKAKEGADFYIGDLNGDGKQDYFVRGPQSGEPALTVTQTTQGYPVADSPIITAFDPSNRSNTIELRDYNGDGRDDLLHLSGSDGYVLDVVYSNASALLQEGYYDVSSVEDMFTISTFGTNVTGTLAGQFRVSESGAATYNIPVFIPQGTAGVKPSVSMGYTSQGGNGIMGDGWSLGAYSAITRCRQVRAIDGVTKPISWTTEDRFCLDGQRLMVHSGTYGAAGSTYRTEIDSRVTVKIHGTVDGEPDYFSVISQDGGLSYYGHSGADTLYNSEQRFEPGKTYMWAQSRMLDNIGNPVEYSYKHEAGKNFRLDRIDYAFGASGAVSSYPMASIGFKYELRPDRSTGFLAGYSTEQKWRLKQVDVNYEVSSEKALRTYHIFYNRNLNSTTAKKQSLVAAIQECVGSSCKVATKFDWEIQSGSFPSGPTSKIEDILKDNGVKDYRAADINGDGVQDLVWLTLKYENEGVFEPANANHYLNYAISENGVLNHKAFEGTGKLTRTFYENEHEFVRLETLDFNLDGRQDVAIMHSRASGWVWEIYLAKPTIEADKVEWVLSSEKIVTQATGRHSVLVDVDGDGLVDVLDAEKAYLLKPKAKLPCDIDCKSDQYYEFTGSIDVPWLGFERYSLDINEDDYFTTSKRSELKVYGAGDFNGDGLIDLVAADRLISEQEFPNLNGTSKESESVRERLMVLLRTEQGYEKSKSLEERWGTLDNDSDILNYGNVDRVVFTNKVPIVADINGDGLSDILWRQNNEISYLLSNGLEFEEAQVLISYDNSLPLQLVDLNYDGIPEILKYSPNKSSTTTQYLMYEESANNGAGGYVNRSLSLPGYEHSTGVFADFNGDGLLDYTRKNEDDLETYIYGPEAGVRDQIVSIRSGGGTRTDITYEPINKENSQHYSGLDIKPQEVSQETQCVLVRGRFSTCTDYNLYTTDDFYTALNQGLNTSVKTQLPSNSPIMEMMGPHYVVTDVTNTVRSSNLDNDASTPDGNSGTGSISNTSTASVSYIYNEAKIQAGGRGFLGFHQLSTVDNQTGVVTTTVYRQDFPFQGSPLATYVNAPNGDLLSESHNVYDLNGVNANTHIPQGGTVSLGELYPYVKTSYEISYATQSSKSSMGEVSVLSGSGIYKQCTSGECPDFSTAASNKKVSQQIVTTTQLDNHGNVEAQVVETYGEGLTQKIETKHTYGSNRIAMHHSELGWNPTYAEMARLTRTTVKRTRNGDTEGARASEFSYYTAADNPGLAGMLKEEVVAPDYLPADASANDRTLTTAYHYDNFGNVERKVVSGWDGVGTVEKTARTEYDSTGRFVKATYTAGERLADVANDMASQAIGEIKVAEVTARNEYGAPTASIGINGAESTTRYDAWGRETYNGSNTGAWASTEYVACPYSGFSCPVGAATAIIKRSVGADGIQSAVFFDFMGRKIRTATRAFGGRFIYVDTEYTVTGKVVRSSEPYFDSDGVSLWTRFYFDELGRPVYTLMPDGSYGQLSYYGGIVTTTNALSQQKEEIKNGFGELVKAVDYTGSAIDYSYTTEGQLRSTLVEAEDSTYAGTYNYGSISGLCQQPSSNLQSIICYDELGRKTQMWDPDKGHWQYAYNAFGQLITQTDANGQSIAIEYDPLGRKRTRTDINASGSEEGTTYWYYDESYDDDNIPAADNAELQLTAVVYSKGNGSSYWDGGNYAERMFYDDYGRQIITSYHYPDGNEYEARVNFRSDGRVDKEYNVITDLLTRNGETFDSGVQNHYNDWGYLEKITNLEDGDNEEASLIYDLRGYDARGQLEMAVLGNGATVRFGYYADTGLLRGQTLSAGWSAWSRGYSWDSIGNLSSRSLYMSGMGLGGPSVSNKECFYYDSLNRLVKTLKHQTSSSAACASSYTGADVTYDSLGNIKSKAGYGDYNYGQVDSSWHRAGPHALTSFSDNANVIFKYDNNGNMLSDGERTFEYSTFNKPTTISDGNHTVEFEYGPSRSRYYRRDTSSNGVEHTWYLGNVEKVAKANGTIEWRRSLEGGGHYTYTTNASNAETESVVKRYMLKDHLGSSSLLMDNATTITQVFGFDEWGLRRDAKDMSALTESELVNFDNSLTKRGFTGHEMVDELHIVHMNGRIYDARWGRFLQADPHIQAPTDVQSYNRYAYVRNNPLNATDPSGYFFVPMLVGAAVGYMFGQMAQMTGIQAFGIVGSIVACVGSGGTDAVACAGGSGFGATYAATGHLGKSLKSGAIASVAAKAFNMIGEKAGSWSKGNNDIFSENWARTVKFGGLDLTPGQVAMQIGGHALVGGIVADLQGGKFGHGFISAGATKGIMGSVNMTTGTVLSRTLIAGAVGGTITDALGGKFANGAATAALGHLFNQEGIGRKPSSNWMRNYFAGRAANLGVSVDFVQPGLDLFGYTVLPETDFVFDIGVVKQDLDFDPSTTEDWSLYYTKSIGDMKGFDIGVDLSIGNAAASSFFGQSYETNYGPLNIDNPGGLTNPLWNHAISLDIGASLLPIGWAGHVGNVKTCPIFDKDFSC